MHFDCAKSAIDLVERYQVILMSQVVWVGCWNNISATLTGFQSGFSRKVYVKLVSGTTLGSALLYFPTMF